MPVGIQRLNARRTQPNPNIVFIKPLPGPHSDKAEKFLERIAAQCVPIMKEHHLSVVTLEEFEPNREFVGRNFNAGEVIQLVLRSVRPPHRWLPFRYVQMVMMHELAHCRQMNHSRAFWTVRDLYARSMTALWARGYTGDGVWGRGTALASGEWDTDDTEAASEGWGAAHLCGGTYRTRRQRRRTRGRKRKAGMMKEEGEGGSGRKEREERRVARKFGVGGRALGADEGEKTRLEGGRTVAGRPRVAGSKRGRELRAAAALARFGGSAKTEPEREPKREEEVVVVAELSGGDREDEETASGSDEDEEDVKDEDDDGGGGGDGQDAALDLDGSQMVDKQGRALVKVCEDEEAGGEEEEASVKKEMEELRAAMSMTRRPSGTLRATAEAEVKSEGGAGAEGAKVNAKAADHTKTDKSGDGDGHGMCCPLCSLENESAAARCAACGHVLRREAVEGCWRCEGRSCGETGYVNAGDCGVCGLCGRRKP